MLPRCFLRALVALSIAVGASSATATDSPGAVFDRYVQAVHATDMAAVRALISPDVERSNFRRCKPEMDNPTCLAFYIESTVVEPRAKLTVVNRRLEGDTVIADLEVRSSLYTQAGVERIRGQDIVRVRNGLIHGFRFVPDFKDEPTAIFFATLGVGPRAARPATKP